MAEKVTGEVLTDDLGRRQCMWIDAGQTPTDHGYIPSIVTEGVAGHRRMSGATGEEAPWRWGPTLEDAERTAQQWNANHGLSKREALRIVGSSIAAQMREERSR